jgi:hypothetical protein
MLFDTVIKLCPAIPGSKRLQAKLSMRLFRLKNGQNSSGKKKFGLQITKRAKISYQLIIVI